MGGECSSELLGLINNRQICFILSCNKIYCTLKTKQHLALQGHAALSGECNEYV